MLGEKGARGKGVEWTATGTSPRVWLGQHNTIRVEEKNGGEGRVEEVVVETTSTTRRLPLYIIEK